MAVLNYHWTDDDGDDDGDAGDDGDALTLSAAVSPVVPHCGVSAVRVVGVL